MYHEIFLAAQNGNFKALDKYKENSQLLRETTFEGNTILHMAAREGHVELVRWILEHCKCRMVGALNVDANTPLHEAAKGGNAQIIDALLQHSKCPAAKRNQFGESALLIASEHGHVDAVRLLLKATPIYLIFWPRNDHQTCLHVAAYGGYLEIVKMILQKPSWFNILHLITLIPDVQGATPLHSAVHGGHLTVAREIVSTSLGSICMSWWDRSLMTKKDKFGRCAVHVAALKGQWNIIDDFMQTMPDCLEIRSEDLKTPLHFAVEHNQFDTVRKLLFNQLPEEAAKAVSCDSDIHGDTALHLAAESGVDPQLLAYLLSFPGVDVNAVNGKGQSVLDIADTAASEDKPNGATIVAILEDAGATRSFIGDTCPLRSRNLQQNGAGESKIMDVDTLVASLIATITFAAIFSAPMGDNDSNTGEETTAIYHAQTAGIHRAQTKGAAEMALYTLFQVFLFSDSLALFASLTVVMAWLFRERLQTELRANRSLLANLSVLSLGVSVVSTGLAFLSATVLVTIPRPLKKSDEKYEEYRLLLGMEILTAFAVPSLALFLLMMMWVFEYYFKATVEVRFRLKRQLKEVVVYLLPPFAIVLGIIVSYGGYSLM